MSPYGGDKEARTPDPLLAKQVLSQLSYTPTLSRFGLLFRGSFFQKTLKIKQYLFALLLSPRSRQNSLPYLPDSLERR